MSLEVNQGTLGGPIPGQLITITNVSAQLNSAALLYEFITPDPLQPIPRALESSYFSIVSYPTKLGTSLAAGATANFTLASVQLTSIPRRIYIFGRPDDSLQTATTSDAYFTIPQLSNPLTVTWNNYQLFSQFTPEDLYNMSVKNGLEMSYSQFMNFTGSIVCIDCKICNH